MERAHVRCDEWHPPVDEELENIKVEFEKLEEDRKVAESLEEEELVQIAKQTVMEREVDRAREARSWDDWTMNEALNPPAPRGLRLRSRLRLLPGIGRLPL